jgi:hypothetical protein
LSDASVLITAQAGIIYIWIDDQISGAGIIVNFVTIAQFFFLISKMIIFENAIDGLVIFLESCENGLGFSLIHH